MGWREEGGGGHRGHWGRQAMWRYRERMRRGDVKFAILEVLAEKPAHGYEIIKALGERRGQPPSPGSVYPTLQWLEDGGFVTSAEEQGRRVYTITDAGRALLEERPPFDETEEPSGFVDLRASAFKLGAAVVQAARGASPEAQAKIRTVLDGARKEVYGILSEDT